jgi:hypothetical protein
MLLFVLHHLGDLLEVEFVKPGSFANSFLPHVFGVPKWFLQIRAPTEAHLSALFRYQTTIAIARRGYDLSGDVGILSDPLAGMAFPLLDIFMFAALFLAAYLYRHRSAIHKRLMLLAVTGALMPSPIAHLTGHFAFLRDKGFLTPLLIAMFLAAGAIYDKTQPLA